MFVSVYYNHDPTWNHTSPVGEANRSQNFDTKNQNPQISNTIFALLFFLNKSKAGRLSPDFIFTTTNKAKKNITKQNKNNAKLV